MKQLIITCFLISIIANPLFCQEISKPDSLLTNEELLIKLLPLVSTYASEDTLVFNQFYSYKRHKKYWDDFFEIQ